MLAHIVFRGHGFNVMDFASLLFVSVFVIIGLIAINIITFINKIIFSNKINHITEEILTGIIVAISFFYLIN